LVVVTQLPSSTPNDVVVKGINMAGGQVINLSRIMFLGFIGLIGLLIAVVPNRGDKPMI
jgi:hypothetical protein